MRKTTVFAMIAAMGVSASALASNQWDPLLDKNISLGTFSLTNGGTGPTNDFQFTYIAQGNEVGFSFSGIYSETAGASYASDTRLEILVNNVLIYHMGGFTNPGPALWDFQGSQSSPPGFYAHGLNGIGSNADGLPDWAFKNAGMSAGDTVVFRFSNGWNFSQTMTWTDANLIIHKIPAPGALALLGVAGLVGSRRRRS